MGLWLTWLDINNLFTCILFMEYSRHELENLVFLEFTRSDLFSGPDKRLYDLVLEELFVNFICWLSYEL